MRTCRNLLTASILAVTTLLTTGCESALFGFANRGLAPPEATATYASDLGLKLDVYRAQGDTGNASAPTVVFIYGGSWTRGEREQYQFAGRRLAQNGMLAIVPDYRTYPDSVFPGFVDDAARAVAWARVHASEYGGDPDRLFIAGHSAGAQIAGLLGADAQYLAAHGVALDEISGVIGMSGPYDFDITGQYKKVFGPPAQWPQAQTVNFVDGDEPPFLLIHGTDDGVVESRDSVQLAEKLRAYGVPATLLLLPDVGHGAPLFGLYDPKREPAVMPAITAFIADPKNAK